MKRLQSRTTRTRRRTLSICHALQAGEMYLIAQATSASKVASSVSNPAMTRAAIAITLQTICTISIQACSQIVSLISVQDTSLNRVAVAVTSSKKSKGISHLSQVTAITSTLLNLKTVMSSIVRERRITKLSWLYASAPKAQLQKLPHKKWMEPRQTHLKGQARLISTLRIWERRIS